MECLIDASELQAEMQECRNESRSGRLPEMPGAISGGGKGQLGSLRTLLSVAGPQAGSCGGATQHEFQAGSDARVRAT